MRVLNSIILGMLLGIVPLSAQETFSIEDYAAFLKSNADLPSQTLLSRHAPGHDYYKSTTSTTSLESYAYLDSIQLKYGLTDAEQGLLARNQFVVTERLSFHNMGPALHDIYGKDIPVFFSTDIVLQALHESYDRLLMDLEWHILKENLLTLLTALYDAIPQLETRYSTSEILSLPLDDVDLYVTVAKSLLDGDKVIPHHVGQDTFDTVWDAILAEQNTVIPLFTSQPRKLDFSQFIPRGHYTQEKYPGTLEQYFRAMMWLGRIDFILTPPPDYPPWEEADIRRMCYDAVLLNELIELSGARHLLDVNNEIIDFMIGESDNLTTGELADILGHLSISNAAELNDDDTYRSFRQTLLTSASSGQKILSSLFVVDPFSAEADSLPVSFRLMGQRFIIDSYIFSNVVYDRIIFNNLKVSRMMPDPLDAMFVLGNDDALHLLEDELERYPYASQLSALRYLVDSYDSDYWGDTLYNTWLSAIRTLNPPDDRTGLPFFMTTAAWQQEKLNTQLASWAQLRHDTLLYAKQSYTGATVCSYPHSFIEPNPSFYRQIASFAGQAGVYFSGIETDEWFRNQITEYFAGLENIMNALEGLAQKELDGEEFSDEECDFLRRMLFMSTGSGALPFDGWIADLYYWPYDMPQSDYVIADVHTQPTDEFGGPVGRVLHVGTGKINLGIFLTPSPSNGYQPMAYMGPVMSYYEKITDDFDRLTDERWSEEVNAGTLPTRPDWVNLYLADAAGETLPPGRELPSVELPTGVEQKSDTPLSYRLLASFPNPFNPATTIRFAVTEPGWVTLTVYSVTGQIVDTLADGFYQPGQYETVWNAPNHASGIYFCSLAAPGTSAVVKLMLVR